MIPRTCIQQYADGLVFTPTLKQAEQALLLRRVMVAVGEHGDLKDKLVCSGGTTLHQALLPNPLRHSEDLDLLVIKRAPLKPVYNAFYDIGEYLGFSDVAVQSRKKFPKIYYGIEHENNDRGLLKIELSQEPASLTMAADSVSREVSIDTPWYSGAAAVRCVTPVDLAASKVSAIHNRNKPRDLSDLQIIVRSGLAKPADIARRFYDLQWDRSKKAQTIGYFRQRVNAFHSGDAFRDALEAEEADSFICQGFDLPSAQQVYLSVLDEVAEIHKQEKEAARAERRAARR